MSVSKPVPPLPADIQNPLDPALARRIERLGLAGQEDLWTERYVLCQDLIDPVDADSRQRFEATSRFIRDLIAHRWVKTRRAREQAAPIIQPKKNTVTPTGCPAIFLFFAPRVPQSATLCAE